MSGFQFSFFVAKDAATSVQRHLCSDISTSNKLCKIIGTDILLLYEAILHLVSLTSIQILALEVVFAYPFYCVLLIMEGINQETLCQIIANFYQKKYSQREVIHGEPFLPGWHPQSSGLPCNCRGH